MEKIPVEQLRVEVLKDIGKVCEELALKQPSLIPSRIFGSAHDNSFTYDTPPPYWYHSSLTPHLRERLSLSQSLRHRWQFSPDVDFISLEVDPETKQMVYKLKINFCNWHFLQKREADIDTSEALREETRSIVVLILDTAFQTGQRFGFRFMFTEIDLSHTASSTRSIFGGSDSQGTKVRREKEIEVLNLSWTQTSSRSLSNFYKATKLSVLILDHCERLRRNKSTESSSVLSLLATHQIPTLKVLSLVGTSNMLSSRWMLHVEKGCPNLETIYFTRKPGEKAIGWDDVIKMQTMRDPCLIPECGHIFDFETLVATRFVCSFDRNITSPNEIIKLSPNITKISRKNKESWIAEIVDHNRDILDDKSLYHVSCGEFYNYKTLCTKYHVKFSSISEELISSLKGKKLA